MTDLGSDKNGGPPKGGSSKTSRELTRTIKTVLAQALPAIVFEVKTKADEVQVRWSDKGPDEVTVMAALVVGDCATAIPTSEGHRLVIGERSVWLDRCDLAQRAREKQARQAAKQRKAREGEERPIGGAPGPPEPGAPKPDPRTSFEAFDAADTSRHWEAIKRAVAAAGAAGACWDEICNAIDRERNTRVRPGSISARLLEMRKEGELRLKREVDGSPVTRAGDSGFAQRVYVLRGEDEAIDAVESHIDDYLGEGHGDDCLHCQLQAVIRTFCIAHPEIYSDEVLAAIAGVVGDRLADEEKYVSADIRDLRLWIRQRIGSIWKKRKGMT